MQTVYIFVYLTRRLIMKFGEKIREQRKKAGLLQDDVAQGIGVTKRTLANYEGGVSYPQDRSVYLKLANFFNVDVNYFLTEDEEFLTMAAEGYGKRGQDQASIILEQAAALFAGGELSETDQLAFLHNMQALFLESKEIARNKFTPNKYKKAEADVLSQANDNTKDGMR
jgi:transcriptional regulator with XRE-family HTH domain